MQELSLIASSLKDLPTTFRPHGFDRDVLDVAVIYGANASGKTNILRALNFFVSAVRDSHRVWKPESPIQVDPFSLDERKKEEPCFFEVDFLLAQSRYQYGFTLNSKEVLGEWLYAYPSGRKQVWYEREGGDNKKISFGKKLPGENRTIQSLTRPNSLFLSAAAQNNHEALLPIFNWATQAIRFEFGGRNQFTPTIAEWCAGPDISKRLPALISAADLGVTGVEVTKEVLDDSIYNAMTGLIHSLLEAASQQSQQVEDVKMPKEFARVRLRHKSSGAAEVSFPNENESAGTAAFLNLLAPALSTLQSGGILCVDELDASLHPLLALEIVRLFNDLQRNQSHAQLIFNTHDVNLLDASVLRRDQIWFTEKDNEGGSHLYSLSDFKPRRHENLKRGYLQGRYGAIPFVGSAEFAHPLD